MDLHLFLLFIACMMLAAGGWRVYMDNSNDRLMDSLALFCVAAGAAGALIVLVTSVAGMFHG